MPPSVRDKFVGTWKLVSCEFRRPDGNVTLPYGPDAAGMLMYDAAGHMAVQFMGDDRPLFASGDIQKGTPEETKAAFDSMVAYFGTYEVDESEGLVTHHLEGSWFPNWVGIDQKRFFELAGNRLTLKSPPLLAAGATVTALLIWERAA